jgi:hypothetical protein
MFAPARLAGRLHGRGGVLSALLFAGIAHGADLPWRDQLQAIGDQIILMGQFGELLADRRVGLRQAPEVARLLAVMVDRFHRARSEFVWIRFPVSGRNQPARQVGSSAETRIAVLISSRPEARRGGAPDFDLGDSGGRAGAEWLVRPAARA